MARVLIVGGDERGRELGAALEEEGWAVRPLDDDALGDTPLATLVEALEGVSVIAWLGGSAEAGERGSRGLDEETLGRLLEEIVDTPVRGVAYETWGAGEAARQHAERAEATWRIRTAPIDAEPGERWLESARSAVLIALAG